MKHLIWFLLLLLALLLPATASAYDFEVDGIFYSINGNEATVTNSPNSSSYSGEVTIPASVTYGGSTFSVTSIGDQAFNQRTSLTSVTIPNSVTSIGNSAFSDCTSLTSVTIGNSVISIGDNAFKTCRSLTSVTIPNSVTSIGGNAFDGTAWYDNQPDGLVYAGLVAYKYKGTMPQGTQINIANGTKGIAGHAFYSCDNLTSITIPNSVTYIGDYAFVFCSGLTRVNISDLSAWCKISFESGTSNPLCYAHLYLNNTKVTDLIIPNSVTTIGNYAFYGFDKMTSVTIPNSVTSIGDGAFEYCGGLTSIDIPNSVISIGDNAFKTCRSLTSVTIGDSVISIGNSAFSDCTSLTSVTIGNSVISIGDNAFYYCLVLRSVTIPNSVISIGSCAFENCEAMRSVTIGNSVTSIDYGTFSRCYRLTSLTIGNSVTSIGDHSFECCHSLTSVTIPNSVTSIGVRAFEHCTSLTSVTIGNSVTHIDGLAFYLCESLTSIKIPNSVTYIGESAFSCCESLTSVTIGNSVISIGREAFSCCDALTTVTIPNSVTSIGDKAFSSCDALTSVYSFIIDPTQISMGSSVFYRSPNNYDQRTLYVPMGTLAAYQADTKWSDYFGSIVEMIYDNYLSMPDITVSHGNTIVIPVAMTNEDNIISFQTDIFLPEGLELMQQDGEYMIDPSPRMTRTHSIMSNDVSNGAVRVICYSSNYKPLTGNSGDDLFYITVKVADDADGDYIIQLKNTLLTNSDFVDIAAPDMAANVHVLAYLLGDANNSGTVTVTDVVVTAQYVLELNPQPFVFEAADVNFDNNITVADVSRIAWMVLNPTLNAPRRTPALRYNGDHMSGEGVTLAAGETRRVSIMLDNDMDYAAFQLDLTLPEGLMASNFSLTDRAGNHIFDVNTLSNGKTRLLCYSPTLTAIRGNEGAVLTFDVTATTAIDSAILVDGIELVTTDCLTVRLDALAIGVNNTTSVNEIASGKVVARVDYYNLAGQQIDRPENGVTVVVTTYSDGTRTTTKLIR